MIGRSHLRRALSALGAAAALLTLSACVTVTAVSPGPFAVGDHHVTLGRQWSDISVIMYGRPKNVRLLSIDGPYLNRLYIADGLRAGEFLVKPVRKEKPTPTWRSGMTPIEQVEFLADSVAALDYQRVETDGLRPAKVGDADGLQVDIRAKTAEGLDIAGVAQAAEVRGRLYVILYLAPAEHYFAAQKSEIDAIMASARPVA